jgi:hypothetical protein
VTEVQVYQIGELPKHAKAKPGVVKFVSKENGGLGSARNFGISLASGRWLRSFFLLPLVVLLLTKSCFDLLTSIEDYVESGLTLSIGNIAELYLVCLFPLYVRMYPTGVG